MSEEGSRDYSEVSWDIFRWLLPPIVVTGAVFLIAYLGGRGEAKATNMNLVDDGRGRESQSALPSDSASAVYGGAEPSTPVGLPPGIYPDAINERDVLCGELGSDWGTSWNIYYALKMAGILTDKPDSFFVDIDGKGGPDPYEDRNWGLDPRNFTEPVGALSCMPLPIE